MVSVRTEGETHAQSERKGNERRIAKPGPFVEIEDEGSCDASGWI